MDNSKITELLLRVRAQKPLLHHITNFVVMNDTANLSLHIGALPIMSHAKEEVEEMVVMAGALVLNPGTLNKEWVYSMELAGKKANKLGVPVVLDPVGAGATSYRTKTNMNLLKNLRIAVLRGNQGEIGALAGAGGKVRGVESTEEVAGIESVALALAKRYDTVVAITGKRDIVASSDALYYVDNGHQLMASITGTGCMSTAMVGAFAAVEKDFALASASALACFGIAGEVAAKKASGPASFRVALLDAVANLTPALVAKRARVTKVR